MFTMDDWLGLLGQILLVAVCLYVVYVVLTAIALVWARRQPERASQPIPSDRDLLDTIIIDMGRVIESEHLEIRTRNRFTAILNRLENYRDS